MLKTARWYLHLSGCDTGTCRTNRQTDRRNPSGYYSALHCEHCRRAVKTNVKIHYMYLKKQRGTNYFLCISV